MRELLIVSGKGGTGKTTIAASLAAMNGEKVIVDADVDASDLYILLKPRVQVEREFKSGRIAVIDQEACQECGQCREACRFEAITEALRVDPFECQGCGVCARVCPAQAISMEEKKAGVWFISETSFGPLVHARLTPGEENSGKLVALVRHHGRVLAEQGGKQWLIVDGPPGIGCPVISAMAGGGAVLMVTEPTPSGLHDLRRVAELASHFKLRELVCINKWDLNPQITQDIEAFCRDQDIPVVARIPYDLTATKALVAREVVVRWAPESEMAQQIKKIWERLWKIVPDV